MTKDVLIQSSVKWRMYNARTLPIQFAGSREKRVCLERYFFFPMMHFHYLHSAHQKDVLSKAVWLLFGVIWWSQGFYRMNQTFCFCISCCLWNTFVEFLKLLTLLLLFFIIMLAKSSCLYRGRKNIGKCKIYVSVNLFTTSVPHSRRVLLEGKHCIIRWCPRITAGTPPPRILDPPLRDHLTLRSHFQPTRGRRTSKP